MVPCFSPVISLYKTFFSYEFFIIKEGQPRTSIANRDFLLSSKPDYVGETGLHTLQITNYAAAQWFTYRLDTEAKGSMGFRIPEDVYKSQGQSPRDL